MEHVAQIIVEISDLLFHNNSRDSFANGVEITSEGHMAKMWMKAFRLVTTYGTGPYVKPSQHLLSKLQLHVLKE